MALLNFGVRFTPEAELSTAVVECPLRAISGSRRPHSINLSARTRNDSGILRSIAFAAFRLMTS